MSTVPPLRREMRTKQVVRDDVRAWCMELKDAIDETTRRQVYGIFKQAVLLKRYVTEKESEMVRLLNGGTMT